MKKNYIIGIAGESGVGKSTISKIISLFFGSENTTCLSTDDLHKWERNNIMWDKFTHLNPDANNLELGDVHLKELSQGNSIFRSVYNHKTGNFNPPIKIEPKDNVIIDGLHAFYTQIGKSLIDLKIYIDTEEELRAHWKIIRDTEERGYKYNVVLDTINKRKVDAEKIRKEQINSADVIIKINSNKKIIHPGDINEEVEVNLTFSFLNKNVRKDLFEFIKTYNNDLNEFIETSKQIGDDIEMCQNGGGNISLKINDDYMFIKSSGYNMKDVCKDKGYSLIDYRKILYSAKKNEIKNDDVLDSIIDKSVMADNHKKPSMETGFHILLKKYVIHVHPIYLTTILCLKDSENIIKALFSEYEYEYVKYVNPAFKLYEAINFTDKQKTIYFLENHGIIVSADNMKFATKTLYDINNKCKNYILNKCDFEKFDLSFFENNLEQKYPFPDSVIFSDDLSKKEIIAAHNYISIFGEKIGNVRHLTSDNIYNLKNMKSEKYRKAL